MSSLPMDELNAVLALTDDVQAAIDAGDWQGASDLEAQRRAKLEVLVAASSGSPLRDTLRDTLDELRRRSMRMIGEVHHHRRRVAREAALLQNGVTAAGSYRSVAAELRE
jgi:hypothetical protein